MYSLVILLVLGLACGDKDGDDTSGDGDTDLMTAFKSFQDALVIMLNLPFALVGGVAGVFLSGGTLSVASIIGFITLFGIATRNGIMLVSHVRHLMEVEGETDLRRAVLFRARHVELEARDSGLEYAHVFGRTCRLGAFAYIEVARCKPSVLGQRGGLSAAHPEKARQICCSSHRATPFASPADARLYLTQSLKSYGRSLR